MRNLIKRLANLDLDPLLRVIDPGLDRAYRTHEVETAILGEIRAGAWPTPAVQTGPRRADRCT